MHLQAVRIGWILWNDLGNGKWNVRALCGAGSMRTAACKLVKDNLDIVAIEEVRWVQGGSQSGADYTLLYGNGNANHHLETNYFLSKGIISAVKESKIY
jgi:hypothetical protein